MPSFSNFRPFRCTLRNDCRQARAERRGFASYASYENDTIANLRIDRSTPVIYQGFTGKASAASLRAKGGRDHLGLPVFNTVRAAKEALNPHATSVFVPAAHAAGAIVEAIEAEIPLVVSVAEHIPVQDMLWVHEVLRTQNKTRLVGPNCPGIIAPEQCRVGIMPHKQYMKGCVGIVSKSGALSYEVVGATTKAGLRQSIVVGMGGDMLPGTTLIDGLKFFFNHPETKGVIVIGEIGGEAELNAAELIEEYRRKTRNPKPIIAMVAGRTAPEGKTMGPASALLSLRDATAEAKAKALEEAGAVVVPHPGLMGSEMRRLLSMCLGLLRTYI